MSKKYEISSDGTIFSVNGDGSITKIARIDENGTIGGVGNKSNIKKQNTVGYWLVIIVLGFLVGLLLMVIFDNQDRVSGLRRANSRYEEQVSQLKSDKEMLQSNINSLREEKEEAEKALSSLKSQLSSYPLIITDVEIGNTYKNGDIETDYGYTIYSSRTMYLSPKITYNGISSGNKTLEVKWIKPDGSLSRGSTSPDGFSQSQSYYIYSGRDNTLTLRGWGNEEKGHWKSGTYKIEIWYDDTCLKSKSFTIY